MTSNLGCFTFTSFGTGVSLAFNLLAPMIHLPVSLNSDDRDSDSERSSSSLRRPHPLLDAKPKQDQNTCLLSLLPSQIYTYLLSLCDSAWKAWKTCSGDSRKTAVSLCCERIIPGQTVRRRLAGSLDVRDGGAKAAGDHPHASLEVSRTGGWLPEIFTLSRSTRYEVFMALPSEKECATKVMVRSCCLHAF